MTADNSNTPAPTTSATTANTPVAPSAVTTAPAVEGSVEKNFMSTNLSKLRTEAPETFEKVVIQALQSQILNQMKRHGERMKKAMREARRKAEER